MAGTEMLALPEGRTITNRGQVNEATRRVRALPGDEQLPQRWGRFELVRRLGSGSYGTVFEAVDPRHGRVALKLPSLEGPDPSASQRLEREAEAMAQLDTPFVCRCLELGETAGRPYLVMELLEGETLEATVRNFGPLQESDLLALLEGLATATAELERVGVVHRDLKPENILLRHGDPSKPVLVDFGLSRTPLQPGVTHPDLVAGTPGYVAPEYILGQLPDHRSDLFAVGMVLRFAFLGEHFWQGEPAIRILARTTERAIPAPLPMARPLRSIVRRLIEIDPACRLPSAGRLLAEARSLRCSPCGACFASRLRFPCSESIGGAPIGCDR